MQTAQPSLFTRDDTIFGACEGIGEDFGFNPLYLRLALAGMLFWNPVAAIGAYLVLGLAVLVSRKLFPVEAAPAAIEAEAAAPTVANDAAPLALPAAA